MARQLLLTIGTELNDPPPANANAAGIAAIKNWLTSLVIDATGIVIDNGSGLSRTARISAKQINALLTAVWNSTWRPEFMSSLSLTALDGTMRKRLKKSGLAGRARIKTGLVNGVRSMSGYVHSKNGKHYIVTMMIASNKVNFWNGNQVQDAVLEWIYQLQ